MGTLTAPVCGSPNPPPWMHLVSKRNASHAPSVNLLAQISLAAVGKDDRDPRSRFRPPRLPERRIEGRSRRAAHQKSLPAGQFLDLAERSEERRVGKEYAG